MDQRQEMMDDAIDDVTGLEDEEESEDVVKEVLDEIGVDLGNQVSPLYLPLDAGIRHEAKLTDIYSSARPRRALRRVR